MDLRQLEMFLAVAEEGAYQQAGRRLHVSHSAVHRQVRLLEAELRDRLFVRRGRRVVLTAAGRALVEGARGVQRAFDRAGRQVADTRQLTSGRLLIGTGTAPLLYFLAPILAKFRKKFPGVEVRVSTAPGDAVMQKILKLELDLGVVYAPGPGGGGEPSPAFERLYADEFVLAMSRTNPLARRKWLTLAEAAALPLIHYPPSSHVRHFFDRRFAEHGLTPRVVMELENEEAMERMIAIDMGAAFLSRVRVRSDRLHHAQIRGCSMSCDVGLALPPMEYQSQATREFAELCREAAASAVRKRMARRRSR